MIGQMTYQQVAQLILIAGIAFGVPLIAGGLWWWLRVRRWDEHLTHHHRLR